MSPRASPPLQPRGVRALPAPPSAPPALRIDPVLVGVVYLAFGATAFVAPIPTVAAAAVGLAALQRRLTVKALALAALCLALGWARASYLLDEHRRQQDEGHELLPSPDRCAATGRITSSPVERTGHLRFDAELTDLECSGRRDQRRWPVRLYLPHLGAVTGRFAASAAPSPSATSPPSASSPSAASPPSEGATAAAAPRSTRANAVSVAVDEVAPAPPARGDVFSVVADLAPISQHRNFDLPDPRPAAARRGAVLSGTVLSFELQQRALSPPALIDRARAHVRDRIHATFAASASGLARALVLGENDLDPEDAQAFQKSGLAHLLAVSGTHLILAVLALVRALHAVLRRMPALAARCDVARRAAWLGIGLAPLYADFAGGSGSAWRAAWMLCAVLGVRASGRHVFPSRVLAASLGAGWLRDGLVVFDPSFSLSIAATTGLIAMGHRLDEDRLAPSAALTHTRKPTLRRAARALSRVALTTLAATVPCLPILLSISPGLSLASIAANLLAAPLGEAVALPFCLAHALAYPLPALERGIALVASGALVLIAAVAHASASVEWLYFELPPPTAWHLACLMAGLATSLAASGQPWLNAAPPHRRTHDAPPPPAASRSSEPCDAQGPWDADEPCDANEPCDERRPATTRTATLPARRSERALAARSVPASTRSTNDATARAACGLASTLPAPLSPAPSGANPSCEAPPPRSASVATVSLTQPSPGAAGNDDAGPPGSARGPAAVHAADPPPDDPSSLSLAALTLQSRIEVADRFWLPRAAPRGMEFERHQRLPLRAHERRPPRELPREAEGQPCIERRRALVGPGSPRSRERQTVPPTRAPSSAALTASAAAACVALLLLIEAVTRWQHSAAYGRHFNRLRVTALDVGQGDATLIDLPDGRLMLIDGGGSVGASFDPGERVILPTLRARRRDRIDILVLTHPHPDHYGGLISVARRVTIGELWYGGPDERSNARARPVPSRQPGTPRLEPQTAAPQPPQPSAHARLLELLSERGVPLRSAAELCVALPSSERSIQLLHPCPTVAPEQLANDNSLVLRVRNGAHAALLVGDAEGWAEARLLATRRNELSADFLKVGHHGSRTSSAPEFIEQVAPRYASISCGIRNRFGHPHPEALASLTQAGALPLRIDRLGAVRWTSDGSSQAITSFAGGEPRAPPPVGATQVHAR